MNNKTKIYFFNPYSGVGGADTTINKIINSINLNIYEVEYFTINKTSKLFKNKIKYTQLNSFSTFFSFFKIIKIIKNDKNKKKIFFSMQYFANVWSILFIKLGLNIKTIIYEINHLDELKNHKNFIEFFKKNLILVLIKFLYKYSTIVATNSRESSTDLKKYVNRRIHTIYNPCFEKVRKRQKKYKPRTNLQILNIARLTHQKDQITLLKAVNFSKFKNQIKLTIVGYGPLKLKLNKYIKNNNLNCKIIDNKINLQSYYSKADLFILSSLYEGLPTVMVEAASNCIPIISSNFKTGSKEILCSGKGGYTFQIRDYIELSDLINKFFKDPSTFYKKELICRKNINKFSVNKNIKIFKNLFNKIQ